MYIGAWPEYHLAKLVAKSDAGEDVSADLRPPCHRVDVPTAAEAAEESLRRVLASRREQARLPPILPNSRPAPSKPRVWQPPLPETPKRTRRTSSVPAAAAPAPPEAPPEALRPHSDRAPQRHRAEVAPRLARTPPWREPQEPKPPLGHLPGWIGQMRSSVEATRQLVKGEEKTLSAAKLEPLGDCSPLKRQEPRCATNAHASTEGSSRSEALAWPPEPKERKQQTIPEMGLAFAEPISSLQSPKAETGCQDPPTDAPMAFTFDEEEEALIAWSQALCLDDISLEEELMLPR